MDWCSKRKNEAINLNITTGLDRKQSLDCGHLYLKRDGDVNEFDSNRVECRVIYSIF